MTYSSEKKSEVSTTKEEKFLAKIGSIVRATRDTRLFTGSIASRQAMARGLLAERNVSERASDDERSLANCERRCANREREMELAS